MTNYNRPVRIFIILIFCLFSGQYVLQAQDAGFTLSGKVLESGSGQPLQQAVVSAAITGTTVITDENGAFILELPTASTRLLVNYPGFHTSELFTKGQPDIVIYLTRTSNLSEDEIYSSFLEPGTVRDATNAVTMVTGSSLEGSSATSVSDLMNGRISGLNVIEHSGMPGHFSWMNMRGISSIFSRNLPVVFIDGMIHEINFPQSHRIEGFYMNPLDIVDMDDIVDITAMKVGEGHMGGAGANGMIYLNTEQKRETSATILMKVYGGVSLPPDALKVMNSTQFESYFNSVLQSEGYTGSQIDAMYPWLNLNAGTEYNRYKYNTNWQSELFKPAAMQRYYLFLKGGDDIATYNISTGYQRHGGPYDNWLYSRYNLRLNGKINISNKLSVTPNTKLSLSDTYLSNMGPTSVNNPVVSSLLKSPLMIANETNVDGTVLFPYDDVGAFNISNPAVLAYDAMGSDRTFQLLTSARIEYAFNSNWKIFNVIGTSVSNARSNIFIPDIGVVQIDSAKNSPQDMTAEFRSTQNHTTLSYVNTFSGVHHLNIQAGARYMKNMYKNSQAIDLNTASDDFTSLGQGAQYGYLRSNEGMSNELKWIAFFADANYKFRDKYYLRASVSYDGTSVINGNNRYNLYPSVFGAWRVTSEDFFSSNWLNDLKIRASYSITGNMFGSIYEYSKPTYTGRRYTNQAVVIRDYNPNLDMEVEKKSTINAGVDISVGKKAVNFHVDYYMASVNNLVINQLLPYNFGFTDYYTNDGALSLNGIEFAADARIHLGESTLLLNATVTKQSSKVTSLEFINPETEFITREVFGAEYVIQVGSPLNVFYGYVTEGIYDSDEEANGIIGPLGREMGAGDVIYSDFDGDGYITELDKEVIGDPNPDLFGSLSAGLAVKRMEVSALFTYSLGNDVYNYVRYKMTAMDSYANQSPDVNNRWTTENTGADLPRISVGDPTGNNVFSDRWIEDGSYLRLKQLKVSYTAPNFLNLQRPATLYITGANLYTLTGYSGYDPETMYLNDPYFMGIDYGKIPHTRSVIFGIQLSL